MACGIFLHGMWNLPGTGTEPMSLALAGSFLLIRPPRKPSVFVSAQRQKQSFIPILIDWSYAGHEPCQ